MTIWYAISGFAFVWAALGLAISGFLIARMIGGVLPLLTDAKSQVQDLGDLAANTVGRASDTMELVELRVSQAMGQATQAGTAVSKQAVGVGGVLAGVFLASRIAGLLRNQLSPKRKSRRKRR